MRKQFIISVITIFILLSIVFYAMKNYAHYPHFELLEIGNSVMALLSLITYLMVQKQADSRPHAFVRAVYSASFLKLMVCMTSVLGYVLLNRANVHKPSVFILFGVYAVYTITETVLLSKIVRESK